MSLEKQQQQQQQQSDAFYFFLFHLRLPALPGLGGAGLPAFGTGFGGAGRAALVGGGAVKNKIFFSKNRVAK
jgi:hypothetical protein